MTHNIGPALREMYLFHNTCMALWLQMSPLCTNVWFPADLRTPQPAPFKELKLVLHNNTPVDTTSQTMVVYESEVFLKKKMYLQYTILLFSLDGSREQRCQPLPGLLRIP